MTAAKKKDLAYYVKVAVGLALMVGFQFLPALAPITPAGLSLLGMFLGLIFLYSCVDAVWPNIAAMCIFALRAFEIYPASTSGSGIDLAGNQVFGASIPFFIIGMLILNYALESCGLLRRIALWFVTRRIARRSPWAFTFMLFLATLVLSLFMDVSPTTVVMLAVAHSIFENLGFKKGDPWPRMVVTAITWIVCIGFWMTPIGHNIVILFTGMMAAATGSSVGLVEYMLVGVPVGLVLFGLMFLYFRFVVRPDVSRFKEVDFDVVERMRPGKMDARERVTAAVGGVTLFLLIAPGFLDVFAPGNGFSALFDGLTTTFVIWAAVAVLAIVRIGGKAILDIPEAVSRISWPQVILVGTIVMVALSMSESTTGIPQWLTAYVGPILSNGSPLFTLTLIAAVCVVLTNIMNNVAVGAIFCTICAPLCGSAGLSPYIMTMVITICSQMGFTTPAAFPTIALATSDEYCTSGFVLRHGLGMTALSLIVSVALIYPLSILVFGA